MPIAGRDQRRRRSGAADPVSHRPRGGCSERAERFPRGTAHPDHRAIVARRSVSRRHRKPQGHQLGNTNRGRNPGKDPRRNRTQLRPASPTTSPWNDAGYPICARYVGSLSLPRCRPTPHWQPVRLSPFAMSPKSSLGPSAAHSYKGSGLAKLPLLSVASAAGLAVSC